MGITIVGLGPGSGRFITREAWDTILKADMVYLRTNRHPAASEIPASVKQRSFDHVYESAERFGDVYTQIVNTLLSLGQNSDIVYAVPGHPNVGESTVTGLVELAENDGVPVRIVPGLSFVEPVLTAVGVDALDGLQVLDALTLGRYHYPPVHANAPLLLGQVYSRFVANEVKLILSNLYDDQHLVYLVHAAGEQDEKVEALPLYAIDRSDRIDHMTSLFVPALDSVATLPALADTIAVLRAPGGCPWDIEQTPQSMRNDLLEEVYEVLAALDAGDHENLREELGDLLYHIVMQAQMASEAGEFSLTDVIAGIDAKLKRRHPHIWGNWDVDSTAEVVKNWEMLKKQEKASQPASLLEDIPEVLPALARSQKIQDKVSKVGFDWPDLSGVYQKLGEELSELQASQTIPERHTELGDLLFVIVNLARWLDVDAESALREANLRFGRRFHLVEQLARDRQIELTGMSLEDLDELWEEAKEMLAKASSDAKV
ncbi:MAG: nucleoside triphosphate pyrophosphohydrolase [Anaerolineaceae bacterium]|nr:MAG: nucleoside triphosphate pyrophosphohydrolase [Anaerolineaceae bacterium]